MSIGQRWGNSALALPATPIPISSPAPRPPDGPFVILAQRPDQVFILPLNSLHGSGERIFLTLVTVNIDPPSPRPPSVDDLLEVVENDYEVEIDCREKSIRWISGVQIDAADRVTAVEVPEDKKKSQPLSNRFPPFAALNKLACEKLDFSKFSEPNLREAVRALRVGSSSGP